MTYGFRPENWPAFQAELQKRGISAPDIEKVEMRPIEDPVVLEDRHRIGPDAGERFARSAWYRS